MVKEESQAGDRNLESLACGKPETGRGHLGIEGRWDQRRLRQASGPPPFRA